MDSAIVRKAPLPVGSDGRKSTAWFGLLCLIATDSTAAAALGRAYRCEVPLGKPGRAFGRSVVAFRDFDAMLDDGQDKQIAWALLKKLPEGPKKG